MHSNGGVAQHGLRTGASSALKMQRARTSAETAHRVVATTISPLLSSSLYAKLVMTPNSTVPVRASVSHAVRSARADAANLSSPGRGAACSQ